jgi:MFS superfamily sulfate permease-like transporter
MYAYRASVILAAVLESLFGVSRLGKLAEYVEEPVIAGFLNAFAVFLVRSQLKVFMIGAGVLLPGIFIYISHIDMCSYKYTYNLFYAYV